MAAMRHKFLNDETIAYTSHSVDVHSLASIQWLEFLSSQSGKNILYARDRPSHSEMKVSGKKVDGFHLASNTAYEFNSSYFHGCPSRYARKEPFFTKQMQKERLLKAAGFTVVSIWESVFRNLQSSREYKSFTKSHPQLQHHLPLNVRHAFFGGRTNASRLYYKFKPGEKGEYVDFTSLYLSVHQRSRYLSRWPPEDHFASFNFQTSTRRVLWRCQVYPCSPSRSVSSYITFQDQRETHVHALPHLC